MAVWINQLQKDLRAMRLAERDAETKALASEEQLNEEQFKMQGMRSTLQAMMAECRNLRALNDEAKAREKKVVCMSSQLCTVADLQSEITKKMLRESELKDKCQILRVKEWHLQNNCERSELNSQMLLHFGCNVVEKGVIKTCRWGDKTLSRLKQAQTQSDEYCLLKVCDNEQMSEIEAEVAEAALEEARQRQAHTLAQVEKAQMRLQKVTAEEAQVAILAIEKRLSKVCARSARKSQRVFSTIASINLREEEIEVEDSTRDILEKARCEDEVEVAFIRKQTHELTMKSVAIDDAVSGAHLEELRGMLRRRRLAVVSPIFGAWLVTACWLVVGAFDSHR